jgi:hypothetical protein
MRRLFTTIPSTALALSVAMVLPLTARADSVASSASSAGSASSASVSDSLGGSSDSSRRTAQVADGEYRVASIDDVPGRPGHARLALTATGHAAAPFTLDLPRATLAREGVAAGDVIAARQRPYGFEFARTVPRREAFFLVLHDDWQRDLAPRAIGL